MIALFSHSDIPTFGPGGQIVSAGLTGRLPPADITGSPLDRRHVADKMGTT